MSTATVKERPILFTGRMVKAILDGSKMQTRRVVKPHPWQVMPPRGGEPLWPYGFRFYKGSTTHGDPFPMRCPYGVPGDRLWVKERWTSTVQTCGGGHACIAYADGYARELLCDNEGEGDPVGLGAAVTPHLDDETKWRPSIHLRRIYSRIALEVTGIRVERVESITDADAIAEGFTDRAAFLDLFYNVNERAPKGSNPWVWVVEFRRVQP
jgi:hypothetical protein